MSARKMPRQPVPCGRISVAITLCCFMGFLHKKLGSTFSESNTTSPSIPDVQIFDFPPGFDEPSHMDPLDPSVLLPRGFVGIDTAHRQGRIHVGSIMYVIDTRGLVLLLRRGPDLVTCPGTWSVVGEHHFRDEEPRDAARRGIIEELGRAFWDGGVEGVSELTPLPLYYIRDYGSANENRVDRQLTYLWEVRLKKDHEVVHLELDEEVADHRWVSLGTFKKWLEDDGADDVFKDFCHETIAILLQQGLDGLENRLDRQRGNK
uniref:Nudix hydrolase domain-containing protein n=1 Tax=Odontella aurita TaxID=265563 RepID=A0A7S4IX81_9STRA|mmetsp:Transcript_32013/g.95882  ORF Transcript_32013/g.95882 Transcript_32013/m.95882 type:complete len:262 (+) Transcript_32013:185-970(+)